MDVTAVEKYDHAYDKSILILGNFYVFILDCYSMQSLIIQRYPFKLESQCKF